MPCKLCRKIGHNSRTCTIKNDLQEIQNDIIATLPLSCIKEKKYYCYILQQSNKSKALNYVGYTVNYNRRLRQHCGIIKGGAMYTKNRGPWEFLAVMHCSSWNNIRALQVEWLIKHPMRKRKRPKCFTGSLGRIKSLIEIINRIPNNEQLVLYIHPDYISFASTILLYDNITIIPKLSF